MAGYDRLIEPPSAGRMLAGRYRLVVPIARGGMAEVWEGHDEVLSRPVAVKVLQSHLAADGVFLERFRREAVTAARLAHPGIVSTFDTGVDEGTAFIVMELVRGDNLRQWLDSYGRLEPWQAVAVTRQVADALAFAHQAGLVHRDVKPANILLVEDEWGGLRVKVTDFGIAKAGMEAGADLTRTGMVLGTPKYLSPEQIRGHDPDPRADLYSLGVVFYEMLVGAPPYVGDTDMATALAHLGDKIPKPSASVRGLPSGLDRVVVDLLAKSPDRRVPSAVELRRRLDGLGPLGPPEPRPGRARRRADPYQTPGSAPASPVYPTGPRAAVPVAGPAEPTTALAGGAVGAGGAGASGGGSAGAPTTALPGPSGPPGGYGVGAGEGGAFGAGGSGRAGGPGGLVGPGGPPGPVGPGGPGHAATTVFAPPPGGGTDQFEAVNPPPGRPRRRVERTVGIVVLALIAIGALVAGVLLSASDHKHHTSSPGGSVTVPAGPSLHISSVQVYLPVGNHQLDNPAQTARTFDGNPATFWSTDMYSSPTFGNLYPGEGLIIQVSGSADLRTLTVTSPTTGWAASAYVSATPVPTGQPVTGWGSPTATQSGIQGSTTFTLGGRKGQYVLLYITNLGPTDHAEIAELAVH